MQDNQEQTPSPPPILSQMTNPDWAEFRRHPATQVLHQYLRQYQEALKEEAWAVLQAGSQDHKYLAELAVRAKMAGEIADLELSSILAFYGIEEERANASQGPY